MPIQAHNDDAAAIRVVIQQPALPHYRIPVFRELERRPGLAVTVLYGKQPGIGNAPPDGFAAHFVPALRLGRDRRLLLWHRAQLDGARRGAADVLVLSWNSRYTSLVPALLRARRNGIPTIAWGHSYSKSEASWRAAVRRHIAWLATALLFYSEPAAADYRRRGWPEDRVFVAPNSLDQAPIRRARERWLADPDGLARFRREQGLGDGPVVLFVSRLQPENRLDVLVQAAARLTGSHPSLQVIVIGGGEGADELARLAARLGVGDRVRFVGPVYEEEALAPWFLNADVFCYPAAVGLSLLHAFGYGLPAVTSDRLEAQNPEVAALRDGENGLLYRHCDPVDLARQLDRIFGDDSLRDRMSEEARRTVTERFDLPHMVDGIEEAIRRVAAARGTA